MSCNWLAFLALASIWSACVSVWCVICKLVLRVSHEAQYEHILSALFMLHEVNKAAHTIFGLLSKAGTGLYGQANTLLLHWFMLLFRLFTLGSLRGQKPASYWPFLSLLTLYCAALHSCVELSTVVAQGGGGGRRVRRRS